MRNVRICIAILAAAAVPAAAQEPPRVEVFGGYSYLRAEPGLDMNGAEASAAVNLTKYFGVEAAVTGHAGSTSDTVRFPPVFLPPPFPLVDYRADVRQYAFLAGPRVAARGDRVTGFAHALFGVAHTRVTADATILGDPPGPVPGPRPVITIRFEGSDAAFSAALGGGLDVKLTDRVAIRVVQADYVLTRFDGRSQSDAKVSAGIVFRFGE